MHLVIWLGLLLAVAVALYLLLSTRRRCAICQQREFAVALDLYDDGTTTWFVHHGACSTALVKRKPGARLLREADLNR